MKSAIFQRPNEASICDIPEPQVLEPDDVKIKVIYTSICADDTAAFTQFRERVTPGHEFSGIIVDLGKTAAMTGLAVGDKVTGYTWRFCGKCRFLSSRKRKFVRQFSINRRNAGIYSFERQSSLQNRT